MNKKYEMTTVFRRKSGENENVLIDMNWQNQNIDPNLLLLELEAISRTSSDLSAQIEGSFLESLIKIYLGSKPFHSYLNPHHGLQLVKKMWEFEGVFSLKMKLSFEDFFNILNFQNFQNTFYEAYRDQGITGFNKCDMMLIEVKRNLSEFAFKKAYDIGLKKIIKMFEILENLSEEDLQNLTFPHFNRLHS